MYIKKVIYMINKRLVLLCLVVLACAFSASAVDFSGYAYNVSEDALNNTNVTVGVYIMQEGQPPTLYAAYSNLSNATGYWKVVTNLTPEDLAGKMIKFTPKKFSAAGDATHVGSNLPHLPYQELAAMLNISDIKFYLKEGATLNVTAVNASGDAVSFKYMVKDTKLGYDIESEWTTAVTQKTIYIPSDRNYSVEIFPQQSMPIYYDVSNLSSYTDPKHVNIVFNVSMTLSRVSGRFNLTNGTGAFDELNIINYLFEPGNMVYSEMAMPYNMSGWFGGTDTYSAADGTYNISLPATAMSSRVLMMALARSGGRYYAAFRNISPSMVADTDGFNFTLYPLLGAVKNISVTAGMGGNLGIPLNQTKFALVNSSGDVQTSMQAHLEIQLRYSQLNSSMPDFTFMADVSTADLGVFYLPLLNYSVKKVNIFSQNFAPKKIGYTAAQINAPNVSINMTLFNPGGIGGTEISDISMVMIKSNANCDVPQFPSSCSLSGVGDGQDEDSFKPLNAVISGGKISLVIKKGNIMVHYINVDMIASGPPDALFDESATSTTSGDAMQQARRFGSLGPEIYDSLIVAFPYTNLDDSKDINVSMPYLYDNDWNVIWNTTANGTSGITTNLTDYAGYNETWFSGINCSRTDKSANCFVNTTLDVIWIRLPHFSGVGPSASGTAAASSTSTTSSGGGGGSSSAQVYSVSLGNTLSSVGLKKNDQAKFVFGSQTHYITALSISSTQAKIRIQSTPVEILMQVGQEAKVNLDGDNYDDLYIKFDSSSGTKATFSVKKIREAIASVPSAPATKPAEKAQPATTQQGQAQTTPPQVEAKEEVPPQAIIPLKKTTYGWIYGALAAALVLLIALSLIIRKVRNS